METSFQKILLALAIIGLIILLVIIGLSLSKSSSKMVWPPVVGSCPDYWIDLKGNGEACYNAKNLGKCNLPTKDNQNVMNFNVSPFNSTDGLCRKYQWANNCGVTWDGINYGVSNLGLQIAGIGLMSNNESTHVMVSPIAIYANSLSISFDCANEYSGLSLGIRF